MLQERKLPFPESLALRRIHSHRGNEGTTLDAEIHFEHFRVADVLDDGNGGEVSIRFFSKDKEKAVLDLLETAQFPPLMWEGREIKPEDMPQQRLENWVEESFKRHQVKKDAARMARKGYKVVVLVTQDEASLPIEATPLPTAMYGANSLDAALKGLEAEGFTHYEVLHSA